MDSVFLSRNYWFVPAGSLCFSVGISVVCCLCVGWVLLCFFSAGINFFFEWSLVFTKLELLVCVGWILVFFRWSACFVVVCVPVGSWCFFFREDTCFCLNGSWCLLSRNDWFVSAGSLCLFSIGIIVLFVVCVSVGSWPFFFPRESVCCLNGFLFFF